jgi:hypothetical protein
VRSIKPDLIRKKDVGAARDLCLRREAVSSIRNLNDGGIRSTQNPDMNKKQISPGSSKGPRSITSSTKAAEPTNSQLGAPPAHVTNPSDAREALENGSLAAVARYLRDDVAPLLRLIAERRHRPSQRTTKPPGYDPDSEFEFDTMDVAWAIENGHSGLVDDFLRQLAGFLRPLGDMLDPAGRGEFQLKPVRRRKGKPKNQKQAILEGNIHRDLRFARIRLGGKLEAAISEVSEKYKCSRATLMRVWAKYEHSRTRT